MESALEFQWTRLPLLNCWRRGYIQAHRAQSITKSTQAETGKMGTRRFALVSSRCISGKALTGRVIGRCDAKSHNVT